MKKIVALIFTFTLLSSFVFAQTISGLSNTSSDTLAKKIVDYSKYRAYYRMSIVQDTQLPDSRTETQTILQIGDKQSLFQDLSNLRKDSINDASVLQGASAAEMIAMMMPLMRQIKFKPTVLKHYPNKGDMIVQELISPREVFRYTDNAVNFDWTTADETKEIEGYTVKKATTSFRGRQYTAWYAEDIPISEGPYLFYGLPGLILEIYDDQNHYHFTLNGFENIGKKDKMFLTTKNVVNSTRKEVHKTIENLRKNPEAILNSLGGAVKNVEAMKGKLKAKPHNPVELL